MRRRAAVARLGKVQLGVLDDGVRVRTAEAERVDASDAALEMGGPRLRVAYCSDAKPLEVD
jgi:hypothetical protein